MLIELHKELEKFHNDFMAGHKLYNLRTKIKYLQSVFPNTDLISYMKKHSLWVSSMAECFN